MSDLIRLSKSVVGKEEANALAEVILNDGMLGMGQYVQMFENKLKIFTRLWLKRLLYIHINLTLKLGFRVWDIWKSFKSIA